MKILDYITVNALCGGHQIKELYRFTNDLDSDVYPLERGSVIVICDTQKLDYKGKTRYAMCVVGNMVGVGGYSPFAVIKCSDSKEELTQSYLKLIKSGLVDTECQSSDIIDHVKKAVR